MRRNWDGSEWTGGEDNWYTDWSDENLQLGHRALKAFHGGDSWGAADKAVRLHEGKPIKEIIGLTGMPYNTLWTAAKRAGTKHPKVYGG